jgi:hypothetical protein
MLANKVRTTMVSFLAACGLCAALLPAAAQAQPRANGAGAECVDGTWGKDQFGNVYYCSGGKWILWSMPAYTFKAF